MKAIDFKNFCNEKLTEVAWDRIILKNYYFIKTKNISYSEIRNPSNLLVLDAETVNLLNETLEELYKVNLETINYL